MYVFGGQGPNTDEEGNISPNTAELVAFNDVYRLDSKTMHWSLIETCNNGPNPRHSHSTCFHERSESILLFGGTNEKESTSNDVWSLNLKNYTWKKLGCTTKSGCLPEGREMHTSCIDKEKNIMLILGGRKEDGTVCQDLWALDIGLFCLRLSFASNTFFPKYIHYLFGSYCSIGSHMWKKLSQPPSPRCAHALSLTHTRNGTKLFAMGGWNGQGIISHDTIVYDIQSDDWTVTTKKIQTQNQDRKKTIDLSRFAHAYAPLSTQSNSPEQQSVMLILGGVNISTDLSDLILIKEM